jgi:TrkA-N domain/RyR domain
VRNTWNRFQWLVVGGLAILAVGLGCGGYSHLSDHQDDFPFYRSLQLFVLESGEVRAPVPIELQIARFLAPFVAAWATVIAIVSLLRDQLQLLGLRIAVRNHVVVAGLGTKGTTLAKGLWETGSFVVVVEQDRLNPNIATCRHRGIPVVLGSAVDTATLRRARSAQASFLAALCGSDDINLRVIAATARLGGTKRRRKVFAHLESPSLRRMLQAAAISKSHTLPFRLEFFDVRDIGSRLVLERHPAFPAHLRNGMPPRAVLIGLNEIGAALAARVCTLWRSVREGGELKLDVVIGLEEQDSHGSLAELETMARSCSVTLTPLQAKCSDELIRAVSDSEQGAPGIVYTSLTSPTRALEIVLDLRLRLRRTPIVVITEDAAALRDLTTTLRLESIYAFEYPKAALSRDLLLGGSNEVLARGLHEQHVLAETAKGMSQDDNPSLVGWEALPHALKESNRLFADAIGEVLTKLDYSLVPAMIPKQDAFAWPDEKLEELARAEHERWVRDLTHEGWKWTSGKKDVDRKLHPLLIPWERLEDSSRETDRVAVRAIPRLLAAAGFEIRRIEG